MLSWLSENLANILVCLGLGGIVFAILFTSARRRKKGRRACGCDCACCAMHGNCCCAKKEDRAA